MAKKIINSINVTKLDVINAESSESFKKAIGKEIPVGGVAIIEDADRETGEARNYAYIFAKDGGVYGGNGANNSDAVVEGMDIYAEARNESTYKGIRFVATISSGNCSGAGTSAATFGIYIMTKDMYDLFRNALTTEKLEAAKAVTAKVTQVKATKYKTSDGGYVVSAVVYGFDTASDKSGELVAIPYAGSKLGDALVTTYNAVFN